MRQLIVLGGLLIYPGLVLASFAASKLLPNHVWQRIAMVVSSVALLYPIGILVVSVIHVVFPERTGLLALTQALAPYLFLPVVFLIPIAFLRRAHLFRWVLLVCLLVFCVRFFPPVHWSTATSNTTAPLTVLNWNVAISSEAAQQARVRPMLVTKPADVVVLEEAYWEWLRRDPTISTLYPYQINHTPEASSGLVILSTYPIREWAGVERRPGVHGWPRLVWARVEIAQDRQVLVVAAHPESPYSSIGRCQRPPCYDTAERDALLPSIRAVVEAALRRNEPMLLVGDFNVTEREPTYADLSEGLQDAHRQVGWGWGNTWGLIPELTWWHFPLLRVDYMFSSPNIQPLELTTDCTPRGSDHCMVQGTFEVSGGS